MECAVCEKAVGNHETVKCTLCKTVIDNVCHACVPASSGDVKACAKCGRPFCTACARICFTTGGCSKCK